MSRNWVFIIIICSFAFMTHLSCVYETPQLHNPRDPIAENYIQGLLPRNDQPITLSTSGSLEIELISIDFEEKLSIQLEQPALSETSL